VPDAKGVALLKLAFKRLIASLPIFMDASKIRLVASSM